MHSGLPGAALAAIAIIGLTYSPAASCTARYPTTRASVEAPSSPSGDTCAARSAWIAPRAEYACPSRSPLLAVRALARTGKTVAKAVVTAGVLVVFAIARTVLRAMIPGA